MSNNEVFLNQSEAREYINSVADPTVRLLLQTALNQAITFLLSDLKSQTDCRPPPFDELTFARVANAFLSRTGLLRAILSGSVTTLEDASWFRTRNPSLIIWVESCRGSVEPSNSCQHIHGRLAKVVRHVVLQRE